MPLRSRVHLPALRGDETSRPAALRRFYEPHWSPTAQIQARLGFSITAIFLCLAVQFPRSTRTHFRSCFDGEERHARHVSAGSVQARNNSLLDGISADCKHDRNRRGCRLDRERGNIPSADGYQGDVSPDKFTGQRREAIELIFRPAIFNGHAITFDEPAFAKTFSECGQVIGSRTGRTTMQEADDRLRTAEPAPPTAIPLHHPSHPESPAASCSPRAQETASYRLKRVLW